MRSARPQSQKSETKTVDHIKKRIAVLHGVVNPKGIAIARCYAKIWGVVENAKHEEEVTKQEPLPFPCIEALGTGRSPVPVIVNGRKLHPGTKYKFRLFAENIEGGFSETGYSETFETLKRK